VSSTTTRKRTIILAFAFALIATAMGVPQAGARGSGSAASVVPFPANPVEDWSEIAETAIAAGRPPASSFVLAGITHAAIFDATVAIEGAFDPYLATPTVSRPASVAAAVATAAHGVLVARVPLQAVSVGTQYADYIGSLPPNRATLNGIAVGAQVAAAYVQARANDGFNNVVLFQQPPVGPGVFEPIPPGSQPVDVKLTQVTPLAMSSNSQFRPDGPDPLTSAEYAADFNEVKALGRATDSTRTPEQTETARFWSDQTFVQWNRTARDLAIARGLSTLETARMLAMINVSAADGAIGCWDAKYYYNLWRPVHAITRADTDGNDATAQDATWNSLLVANHPEYPSGHSCATGAITSALAAFFGTDDISFQMSSTMTGTTRTYASFSDSLGEVIEARIYSGLHFRNSNEEGAELGRNVANLVTSTLFQPTG
jgi:hypothetical protein